MRQVAPFLALILLAACTRGPADPIAAARAELAAGQQQAAVVILKDALQRRDDFAAARAELGRALLLTGDAQGALVELQKAQAAGAAADQVLPLRARAQLAIGDVQAAAQDADAAALTSAQARADLSTTRAEALARLGDADGARSAVQVALQADTRYAPALRLYARLQATAGQADAAQASLQAALDADPRDADAWALRGDLLHATGRASDAQAAWSTALQHHPRLAAAHGALLAQALAAGDDKAAQQRLAAAQAALPGHPVTWLYQGRLALQRGDLAAARAALQPLLKLSPDDPRVLLLASETEWRAGSALAALPWLQKAVARSGTAPGPRLLLAQVQLATDDAEAALQTLQPLLAPATLAAGVAALAGEAQLRLGRLADAQNLFERAAQADPQDPRHALGRALALAARDARRGMAELRALAAAPPGGMAPTWAHHALAALLLRSGDRAGALQVIDTLDAAMPTSPQAPMMRGQVLLQQGDRAGARKAFEVARQRAPRHLPATLALAELDAADGHPQAGIERLGAWLAAPDISAAARSRASLALAQAQAAAGLGAAQVRDTLEAAVQQAAALPPAPALAAHQALVRHHLQQGQGAAALAALQAAEAAHPQAKDHADWQPLQAQVLVAGGQPRQAVQVWRKRLAAAPRSAEALAGLALAHQAAGETAAAQERLNQALALDPARLPTLQALLGLAQQQRDSAAALRWARQAQQRQPRRPEGWQWEGSLHAANKAWPQAIAAWQQAMTRAPGADHTDTAMKLYTALRAAGRGDEAARWQADWQSRHPGDPAMPLHVADTLAAAGQHAQAETMYRQLLPRRPQDARLLNNLAWVRLQQRADDALPLAEQAARLDTDNSAAQDTWAQALAQRGDTGRAVQVLKAAVDKAPRQPGLHLSLARVALQGGDRSQARESLQTALQLAPALARRSDVVALQGAVQ